MPAPAFTGPGWRIGSLRGIPVYLGRTWPVIAFAIVVLFGTPLRTAAPWLGAGAYLVSFAYALLLLVSVLLHEVAHAVVAQRCGYRVRQVVADLWGGHTAYDSDDSSAGKAALIAVVGPLANFALAGIGWVVMFRLDHGVPGLLAYAFAQVNLFVALFNLLPALPLDGGYLVDSAVWRATGSRAKGQLAAGWLGRALTVAIVAYALWPLLSGQQPSIVRVIWSGMIAMFIWAGATDAIQRGRIVGRVETAQLSELLRPVQILRDSAPVSDLAQGVKTVVVDANSAPWGMCSSADLPPDVPAQTPVGAVALRQPDGWVLTVQGRDDLMGLLHALPQQAQVESFLVVDRDRQVLGLVFLSELERALTGTR